LLAIALLAGIWLFRLTRHGLGVGSDSTVYFAGAQSLNEGNGFVWIGGDRLPRPINHYPPFYSVILALGLRFGLSPAEAARTVEVLLTGANVLFVAALTGLLTSSGAAAILGALLFAASEETLSIHSWAMSDGLYLLLVLVCVTSSTHYWVRGATRFNRALMWGSVSLAFLTRYIGMSLVLVPVVATLTGPSKGKGRWREAGVGLALATLPGLVWLMRNEALTGSATNRRPGFFPQGSAWWQELGKVAEPWFVPGRISHLLEQARVPLGISIVVVLLVGAGVFVVLRGRQRSWSTTRTRAWLPLVVMMGAHLGAIGLSSWTTYPGPDINTRTLAPVYVASLVLVAAILGTLWSGGPRLARAAAVITAVALLAFKAYSGRDMVARLLADGQGYTSKAWSRSQTVAALQGMNAEVVYASDIGAAYYFTGRFAYAIPVRYDPITRQERAQYPTEYCLMRRRLQEENGVVVFFGSATLPQATEPEVVVQGLEPIYAGPDGAIYADSGRSAIECTVGGGPRSPKEEILGGGALATGLATIAQEGLVVPDNAKLAFVVRDVTEGKAGAGAFRTGSIPTASEVDSPRSDVGVLQLTI
jgi:4-amino-4-deoxy-L-arabinose transferase-like glycosyltransferase